MSVAMGAPLCSGSVASGRCSATRAVGGEELEQAVMPAAPHPEGRASSGTHRWAYLRLSFRSILIDGPPGPSFRTGAGLGALRPPSDPLDAVVQAPDARVAVSPRAVGRGSARARLAAASVGPAGGARGVGRSRAQPRLAPRPLLAGRLAGARAPLAGAAALRDPHLGAQRGVSRRESGRAEPGGDLQRRAGVRASAGGESTRGCGSGVPWSVPRRLRPPGRARVRAMGRR